MQIINRILDFQSSTYGLDEPCDILALDFFLSTFGSFACITQIC